MMTKQTTRFIQSQLSEMGLYTGPIDGIFGLQSIRALDEVNGISENWPIARKATSFIQLLAKEHQIETGPIDGFWGPQTEYAFESLLWVLLEGKTPKTWRPEDAEDVNPNRWPSQSKENDLFNFYGQCGTNQTEITLPYPHRLSWKPETTIDRFRCHEKVHDSLHRVLSRVLAAYGPERIRKLHLDIWGGCLSVRPMRGGVGPSTHSWGIAVDYDPARNRLKWGRDRAAFANSEFDTWWRLWEEEGWVSLGRTRNFDWMHIQAAKI